VNLPLVVGPFINGLRRCRSGDAHTEEHKGNALSYTYPRG